MKALDQIKSAVNEFQSWVVLPELQENLEPKLMLEFSDASLWADQYKVDAARVGCYAFEGDSEKIYYVGSVSANSSFGYRFANGYICKDPKQPSKVKRLGKASKAKRIFVVDLPREYAFVAPALEQFLITYMNPEENRKDFVQALFEKLTDEGRLPLDFRQ